MSQSARTPSLTNQTDGTNRPTKKPSETLRPHYYTTFQKSCCASKADSTSPTQSKDVLPIPIKFKKDAEALLTPINGLLVEELSKVASYTSYIPDIFFEKNDNFQIQKYLIDRVMLRTLEEADIINWNVKLKKLYPIRTSGNGNCLLHAVLIAMIGIHDTDLYLRDRLAQFMNDNKDLLKTHWRIERLKSDKNYGISSEDSKLDEEWKELCDLVHYENSEDGQAATQLQFLEAVHIFSVCNMLRRPIIVLSEDVIRNKNGEAISVNDLYGIYLPILSSPTECINEPIVLAYDRSHFCPLQTSDTKYERTSDNLLPLYPSVNHILENTLLPIRFLGDDVTAERSNNLLREYLRIKQVDHIVDSSSAAMPILCAELGSKYLSTKDNFFLLYCDYVIDFFEVQKPKAIEEERKREKQRELDDYVARHPSTDVYGPSILRYDTSPTRTPRTSYSTMNDIYLRNPNGRSYDLDRYADDFYTRGAYTPRSTPYFETDSLPPYQSQRSSEYAKTTQREPIIGQTYSESIKKQSPSSNSDIISNPTSNRKMMNSVNIQVQGTDSRFNQERPQSTGIEIPIHVVKPSSSSDNQNLTIYEQRRAPLDLCILCDRPFDDVNSTRFCPTCDYKIHNPNAYGNVSSRPSTRPRATNMYLPISDRGYTPILSPVPKTRPLSKIICPNCKNPNLLHNLTRDTDFRCSACQNPIPSAYLYRTFD